MRKSLFSLLCALLFGIGSFMPASASGGASVQWIFAHVTCDSAAAPQTCAPAPIHSVGTVMRYISIENHANGGEQCRASVHDGTLFPWVTIAAGDNSQHELAFIEKDADFDVICQRLAPSGDATITGTLYQTFVLG
jgi:hypothetical protein